MTDTHKTPGAMKILAKYLYGRGAGAVFTVAELEREVETRTGKHRTEVDRRLRDLRKYEWVLATYKTDSSLRVDQYRLDTVGQRVWEGDWKPPVNNACSSNLRQAVLHRDSSTCRTCGARAGDAYSDEPDSYARLTVARRVPGSLGGEYNLRNCYAECARCNERERDSYVSPAIKLCRACGGTGEQK